VFATGGVEHTVFLLDASNFQDMQQVYLHAGDRECHLYSVSPVKMTMLQTCASGVGNDPKLSFR
jgi:hypothetical protein